MKRKNATRSALITSVISLLLCVSMLVGVTFAWFTDEVKSGNNLIAAGNLDVELEYAKVVNGQITGWTSVQGASEVFDPNALWEPGRVEVVYLKVSNLGTLNLKYQLGVNVASEVPGTNVAGETFLLSDHLVFKVVEMPDGMTTYDDREVVAAAAGADMGLEDYNGTTTALEPNGVDYVALIVYMPTSVGNEANYRGTRPEINLGVNLFATQLEAESDSFGPDYDEDAWIDGFKVHSAEDLQAAINNGKTEIVLMSDIETDAAIVIPEGATVALNLNGKEIKGTVGRDADNNRIHVIVNNGILTIKDGTVKSDGNDGGSAIYNNAGATLTIEDVTLYGAPQSDPVYEAGVSKPFPSYAVNNYGNAVVNGATVKSYHGAIATGGNGVTVINDADIDVGLGQSTGITSYLIYSFDNAQVTVNDGKFAFTKQEIYVNGGNTFCELGINPIIINGGNYTGTSFSTGADREYVIKGGTFDVDPSTYVADGYQVVDNGDGTYTVLKGEAYVKNSEELAAAINEGKQEIALAAGTFTLPNANNKNVTLIGVGTETIVDYSHMGGYQEVSGSSFNFKNMTLNVGNTWEKGLQHTVKVTYEDCHIIGWQSVYANEVEFTNCTLDSNGGEHCVWTYSADKITFKECDFTYTDRAVNCFGYEADDVVVTFTECTFTKVAGKDTTGAIETNSSNMNSLTLTINDCSVNEGELWFIAGWDSQSGAKTTATVNGSTDKGVVLVQSGVLPYLTLNSNATYMLTGDFGGQNVSLVMPVGVENIIFDGSKATNINELIIVQNGKIIDNANDPIGERSGNVTVQNFNVLSQINVFACKTEVVVQKNAAEALMIHAGNCNVKVLNNTIDANFESHPTYQNATQTWNTNNYGIALNIFDYNLWLDGNTVTDATGHAIGINGWEGTIDNGDENVIESFKGNTITVNSTSNTKRAAFKVWDDETYASNDDDTNVINTTAQAFIDAVLADGSNTFNIVDGYDHTIFSFYNVNTNN